MPINPAEVGIAAYELATQIMVELGWDAEKRRAVFDRTALILDQQRPEAAAAVRSVSQDAPPTP